MQQEAGYSNRSQNWVGDWMGDWQESNVKKNSHVTDAVWDQNVCMYVYMYVCMHVYVRVNVCVCMCVCVWEREREREHMCECVTFIQCLLHQKHPMYNEKSPVHTQNYSDPLYNWLL